MNSLIVAGLVFLVLLGAVTWTLVRKMREHDKRYRDALESYQRKLDQQASRLNILTRSLPRLKESVAQTRLDDSFWKNVGLEEARALVWADAAWYWRFIEEDEAFEVDHAKGPAGLFKGHERASSKEGSLGEAAQKRIAVLEVQPDGRSDVYVPLVVLDELRGVIQLRRTGSPSLTRPDMDFVAMFVGQLALTVENREMVVNRERFYLELVQTFADALDSKDSSTEGQSRRAREFARGIARELDLPDEFSYYLEFAALMHDIGKIGIDESVLRKPGKLTKEEFEMVKKHPELGHRILAPVSLLAPVAPMVLYHQEWFNGKGYPEGLSGEEIPLGARIVAILDAWAAMTSDRPWRKALPIKEAVAEIKKGAGTQFDPHIVDAFLATLMSKGYLSKPS